MIIFGNAETELADRQDPRMPTIDFKANEVGEAKRTLCLERIAALTAKNYVRKVM